MTLPHLQQHPPLGMLVWLMFGLPLWLLLIMYLRRKRKISRLVATVVNTLSIAGSFTWDEGLGWFLFAVVLFLPVGYIGALIAEVTARFPATDEGEAKAKRRKNRPTTKGG